MRKLLITISSILIIPMTGYSGFNIGLINAAKKTVNKLDEKVQTKKSTALPSLTKLSEFGSYGSGNGQLDYPRAIFTDGLNLYVSDYNNYRIQKFDLTGNFISWFGFKSGVPGYYTTGTSDFDSIPDSRNIYVDSNTYLSILTVSGTHAIYKVNQVGANIGQNNLGNGQFSFTIDTLGRIISFNILGNVITIYNQAGAVVTSFGGTGSSDGKFQPLVNIAESVAVDASYNIYVADVGNNRIQKFDSNGNFLTKWDSNGSQTVTVDESNNIYALGSGFKKYTSSGVLLKAYNQPACGDTTKQIAVRSNKLYCADESSNKVLVYQIP